MNPQKAEVGWPAVVVASVFQTGLNLMRDLLRHGLQVVGVDCEAGNAGFHSDYGKSYLCPNPDDQPAAWVAYMQDLARQLGGKPVIIPAADIFVSALGRHADVLKEYFTFSLQSVAVQAALATKEQQYELAAEHGLPIPRTTYIRSRGELEEFVSVANFPCLLKPRHQREWEALPEGNPVRGLKLATADSGPALLALYDHVEVYRPEVMAQEIIPGRDDDKFCYLSVYGQGSRRLGYGVVRELRAFPLMFGSASVAQPVVDAEITDVCDRFLRAVHYVGICEIEVKRDARNGRVFLIEANPRFSVTGDVAIYMGVDLGWLHYLDLIGEPVEPVAPNRYGFRHIVVGRDLPAMPMYVAGNIHTWAEIVRSYRGPLEFFDFDWHDRGPTWRTLKISVRQFAGGILRNLGLRKRLRGLRV